MRAGPGTGQRRRVKFKMEDLYLLVFLGAMGWLLFWCLLVERRPDKGGSGPFGMRDADEYRRKYGDRRPF